MTMSTPLTRFAGGAGRKQLPNQVSWGRADLDGLPFLGNFRDPIPASEDEYHSRVVVSKYFQCRRFDLSVPDDHAAYVEVMDRIINGWYEMYYRAPVTTAGGQVLWYVEWGERYLQDGKPSRMVEAAAPKMLSWSGGPTGGQQNGEGTVG